MTTQSFRPFRPLRTFTIVPALPPALGRLREIAMNLRWAWDREPVDLFRRLDPEGWESSGHNPILLLGAVRQERLEEAVADEGFVAQYRRVCERLAEYMNRGMPAGETAGGVQTRDGT